MRRGGWRDGETARGVGVDAVLRPGMLVFRVSREGRWEEAGEWAREELIEGLGEERVDMVD